MYATRFSSERAWHGAKKCVQFILRDEKNSYFTRIKLNSEYKKKKKMRILYDRVYS